MKEGIDVHRELDALSSKVYQAKELISRLRQSNRELSSRLSEVERHRKTTENNQGEAQPDASPEATNDQQKETAAVGDLSAQIESLQNERREVRRRVSLLLRKIEALEL